MGRDRKNFLSLLDNDKVGVFCAFDKDYSVFRGKKCEENIFKEYTPNIKKCIFMDQIHSNIVQFLDENLSQSDGLIGTEKNMALCVLSADCLPLLLWHESGIIAGLHAGRKGCFDDILGVCLEKIYKKYPNLDNNNFHLFIGPSICVKHYEINGQVLDFTKQNFKDFLNENYLNLQVLIKKKAKEYGILNIKDSEICTFENENFPSYRKDKTQTRFASVIYLKA
ncbi:MULTISPECIES: polyphenol oxidase family protein [unclassified Campylobacter]|uniref:polyphenol oxidase family protein n=1 Tax=unclassified Campylobacter TaxID=2593542 RepID=UPI001237E8F9|nr:MULTISPECIES: polyphenol oxidase family protein [unclassified Campylobacter]KAA6225448.1 polyphenol oxidase family protein [Campylobacter sp. LR196d]KAA6228800.1 polyphenol oxidase family protein [Campylobacter sp. LR185c]KAA6229936.1 polyphenol oxidase family protein [Campylobacter sp. LR286c]KAA6234244.1 polyphenol oxidase family protein [Campylobacter sp. LR291e]KAA6234462.1 polyphenol oxidase family protein [Campylobacter sp. LR264d]